jgi:hypothetical protein
MLVKLKQGVLTTRNAQDPSLSFTIIQGSISNHPAANVALQHLLASQQQMQQWTPGGTLQGGTVLTGWMWAPNESFAFRNLYAFNQSYIYFFVLQEATARYSTRREPVVYVAVMDGDTDPGQMPWQTENMHFFDWLGRRLRFHHHSMSAVWEVMRPGASVDAPENALRYGWENWRQMHAPHLEGPSMVRRSVLPSTLRGIDLVRATIGEYLNPEPVGVVTVTLPASKETCGNTGRDRYVTAVGQEVRNQSDYTFTNHVRFTRSRSETEHVTTDACLQYDKLMYAEVFVNLLDWATSGNSREEQKAVIVTADNIITKPASVPTMSVCDMDTLQRRLTGHVFNQSITLVHLRLRIHLDAMGISVLLCTVGKGLRTLYMTISGTKREEYLWNAASIEAEFSVLRHVRIDVIGGNVQNAVG